MKLEEAYKKAGDNDSLRHKDNDRICGYWEFPKKDFYSCCFSAEKVISDDWEIIPADPEVLSADMAAEKYNSGSANGMTKIENAFFRVGYDYGRKYWRLERDKELRKAIKLANEVRKAYFGHGEISSGEFEKILAELDEEIQNIPPLNKDE